MLAIGWFSGAEGWKLKQSGRQHLYSIQLQAFRWTRVSCHPCSHRILAWILMCPGAKGQGCSWSRSLSTKWAPWSEFRDGPTELVTAKIIFVEGASPNVYEQEVFKSIRLQIDPEVSSIFRFLAPGYQMQRWPERCSHLHNGKSSTGATQRLPCDILCIWLYMYM